MGIQKNIKISLNIPEDYYVELSSSAVENERTLTGEVMYRLRRYEGGNLSGKGTIPSPKKEEIKTSTEVEKLVKRGLVKKGAKELPSQDTGGFKTYFK
jgi:hypothetical protein